MKRLLAAAGLVLGALLLTGCTSGPKEGVVASLSHRSEYVWMMPVQHCTGTKYPTCWTQYIPMTVPECWRVNIRNQQGRNGAWCVSETRWHTLHEGDHFVAKDGEQNPG